MIKEPSIMTLPPSICHEHNLPFETYCSSQSCQRKIRVCLKCKPNHSHDQKFFTPAPQVVSDLSTGLNRCFSKIKDYDERTAELSKLIKVAQTQCKNEYQEMESNLIELIKQDKKVIEKKILKMEQTYAKIQKTQRLKNYFTRLQQSNLLLLKIKLSNEKGMLQLKERNQKTCEFMSKSSYGHVQKLYSEFYLLKNQIQTELQNNFTFKLGQVIALKNSRKQAEKKVNLNQKEKENGKENAVPNADKKREKNKPKTETNFGEGFINGILNFLNF